MATLFAPPVLSVAAVFALFAKESPTRTKALGWKDYGEILREPDTLWFSILYSLTFGGFVGFASFLTTFFHDQYHVSRVTRQRRRLHDGGRRVG